MGGLPQLLFLLKVILECLEPVLPILAGCSVILGLQISELKFSRLTLVLGGLEKIVDFAKVSLEFLRLSTLSLLRVGELEVQLLFLLGEELDVAVCLLLLVFKFRAVDLTREDVCLELEVGTALLDQFLLGQAA